jgi:uncharacterized membrane protein
VTTRISIIQLGHLHPLLVHFPIALVLAAAAAEAAAIVWPMRPWHVVAVMNVRVGAAFSAVTAVAGWLFVSSAAIDHTPPLEWHRWVGIAGAVISSAAALLSSTRPDRSPRSVGAYRLALFAAAVLVGIAGHLGGMLVWGAPFQP